MYLSYRVTCLASLPPCVFGSNFRQAIEAHEVCTSG
jgi:hypothetical protein